MRREIERPEGARYLVRAFYPATMGGSVMSQAWYATEAEATDAVAALEPRQAAGEVGAVEVVDAERFATTVRQPE